MNGSKLYASVKYRRPAMKRMIVAVSHSVKALRRKHGGHIFAVTKTPIPASQCGLNEYTIVGKEIKA